MGRTTIAVTTALLDEVLQLPAGTHVVSAEPSLWSECVDLVIEGPDVPDAKRCTAVVHKERVRYEFIEEADNG